jgi:hypothetical protein
MDKVNAIRRGMWRAAPAVALFFLTACASPPRAFPDLPRLNFVTNITSRNMCGLGVSPAITIANAPQATASYRFRLVNTDVLFQEPWQTTVAAAPSGYREGAIPDYEGPCFGERRLYALAPYFRYRFEALALDGRDRPLAYGQVSMIVRTISETIELEKAAAAGAAPPPPTVPPASEINPMVNPALYPRLPGVIYEP